MRTRDVVALVLAVAVGLSVLVVTAAAMWDAVFNTGHELSPTYSSLVTATLGVLVGALAGYIGGRHDLEKDWPANGTAGDETAGRGENVTHDTDDSL